MIRGDVSRLNCTTLFSFFLKSAFPNFLSHFNVNSVHILTPGDKSVDRYLFAMIDETPYTICRETSVIVTIKHYSRITLAQSLKLSSIMHRPLSLYFTPLPATPTLSLSSELKEVDRSISRRPPTLTPRVSGMRRTLALIFLVLVVY